MDDVDIILLDYVLYLVYPLLEGLDRNRTVYLKQIDLYSFGK